MRVSSVKGSHYVDSLAQKRRRSFIVRLSLMLVGIVLCVAGVFYALFYSSWFDLNDYEISGAQNIDPAIIKENLNTYRDYRLFKFLPVSRNILFFDVSEAENVLLEKNNLLKTIQIEKKYFHALSVTLVERNALGVWCFENYIGDHKCKYFDIDMKMWGDLDKTTGFILLTVEDYKTIDRQTINKEYFDGIRKLTNNLRSFMAIKSIAIPAKPLSDLIVYTDRPYYLQFSLESNIDDQISVLKIFLNNKKDDPNFAPQYLDLRVDGRVYYK